MNKSLKWGYMPSEYFSKYRKELMGIATIMILIIHSYECRVTYPKIIDIIFSKTFIGVDIFLFVSGLGCMYSLKENNIVKFYVHRIQRIMPYYLPIVMVFAAWKFIAAHGGVIDWILYITTLSFWQKGIGFWYIALLLPLYFATPYIERLYRRFSNPYVVTTVLIIAIFAVGQIFTINDSFEVGRNVDFALKRVPSFFVGMLMGYLSSRNDKFSIFIMLAIAAIVRWPINQLTPFHYVTFALMLMVLVLLIIVLCINKFACINNALKFMGSISLESYLINSMLIEVFKKYNIIGENIDGTFLNEDALVYIFICGLGIFLAYLYHNLITLFYNCFIIAAKKGDYTGSL